MTPPALYRVDELYFNPPHQTMCYRHLTLTTACTIATVLNMHRSPTWPRNRMYVVLCDEPATPPPPHVSDTSHSA